MQFRAYSPQADMQPHTVLVQGGHMGFHVSIDGMSEGVRILKHSGPTLYLDPRHPPLPRLRKHVTSSLGPNPNKRGGPSGSR